MAQTYAFIREECVAGVLRSIVQTPRTTAVPQVLDRIRAQFDAAFFSINSQTAQAYAAQQDRRELLRKIITLTFVSGDSALPDATLKAYIEDATLVVSGKQYTYRRYPDWFRSGEKRLGAWTQVGDTIKAKTSQPVAAYSGSASFSSICSPDVPLSESDPFDAPEDYVADLIAAMTQFILGQTVEQAAQTS